MNDNLTIPHNILPVVTLIRSECISASHRLHNDELTADENKTLYGKCNNFHGHGHNYKIDVAIRGPVDPVTGFVMNIADLKGVMYRAIVEPLDHKNLDFDVPFFKTCVSTTENLAVFIWNQMKKELLQPDLLYEIKIFETDKNSFTFRGDYL